MSLSDIKTRIADAEVKYSRPSDTTSLIAVSKLQPNDRVVKVLDAGHREFGENYVQEAAAKWPTWRPTNAMIERDPDLYAQHAEGMDAGPTNPLGSRALYLYVGNRDTYLRIHGSPYPRSIGGRASSGCVRMIMAHINDLYPNVETGKTAHLYPPEDAIGG